MRFIYEFLLGVTWRILPVIGFFNAKMAKFISGRKQALNSKNIVAPIWFHCASVGEFEQARPLIEELHASHQSTSILVSFFSPSGFEHFHSFDLADDVVYAPFDTAKNVKKFIAAYEPKALVLIKYEFWSSLIYYTYKENIPIYSVSSVFRADQRFFKWYGGYFRKDLKKISRFFVQDSESKNLLKNIGIEKVEVIGDTRFDRVIKIAENNNDIDLLAQIKKQKKCLVAGSTWPKDDQLLLEAYRLMDPTWCLVIAPHEVHKSRVDGVISTFKEFKTSHFSGASQSDILQAQVVVIDSLGLLNRIYKYADICYIGGAFGAGLHNILEAAVWGKPLVHGPKFEKFKEASELLRRKGSYSVLSKKEGKERLVELSEDAPKREEMGEICKAYVYENMGATLKVISFLKKEGIF